MKTHFCLAMLVLVGALSVPISSTARNTKVMWPIADAMAAPDARSRLSTGIRPFFGNSGHPAVTTSFGVYTSNKKTNGTYKSDKEACISGVPFQGEVVKLEWLP